MINGLDFSDALLQCKAGEKIYRDYWGPLELVEIITPEDPLILPYFKRLTVEETYQYGWQPTQDDMLAHDWIVYEEGAENL